MTDTPAPGAQGRLAGRSAIVTGGAHGIGRAYCLGFACEGANVAVLDLDSEGALRVADEIKQRGGEAVGIKVDISDEDAVGEAVTAVYRAFPTIEILMNNAGMYSVVPMSTDSYDKLSVAEFERMMDVNVKGTFLMCRAVVPRMQESGYGKVINISSASVFKGGNALIHYVTSKAAIIGLTRTLAREVGRDGITVNMMFPGNTASQEFEIDDAQKKRREATLATRAIPRHEVPEDLVGTAIYLASADSDFMTGQSLIVDGGAVMH